MTKHIISDFNLNQKKVLLRVDFNIPLTNHLTIADDTRIKQSLPTIEYALKHNASLILMSHLGRPKGKKDPHLSLKPCAIYLEKLLKTPVAFAPDCLGTKAKQLIQSLQPRQIVLLENLRFYSAEEHPEQDLTFAEKLASYGDIYVNDAFATAHRKHSSTAIIASYFPKKSAMGFLMKKEVDTLNDLLKNPKQPFFALLGGSKISTKIGVLESLIEKVDRFFIGGGMAFTFLKALGYSIGSSLFDASLLKTAENFLKKTHQRNISVDLPDDFVVSRSFSEDGACKTVCKEEGIKDGWMGMDIGQKTIQNWSKNFLLCKTLFWNGPLGVFELKNFSHGTFQMAQNISQLSATTVVGGGDSVAAIQSLKLTKYFTHISTGGGACLELLEFGHLPGIDALSDK